MFRYQKGITPHIKSRKVRCLCGFPAFCLLFELNRSRWLRAHIKTNPVHMLHLCQNPVCNPLQHIPVYLLNRCAHSVNGIDCPDDYHIVKASGIVLHSHRFKIRHYRKILPYLFIQTCLFKFLTKNRIRFPDSFQTIPSDCS